MTSCWLETSFVLMAAKLLRSKSFPSLSILSTVSLTSTLTS